MSPQPINPATCTNRIQFTSSARAAWRLILEGARLPEGCSILLPSYIGVTDREGSGVFDPVLESGTPYAFYRVNDRLHPDLGEIEAMLRTHRHPLLLLIHYFGLPSTEIAHLKRICDQHGVYLIEDCAHVPELWMALGHGIGSIGDAAFYSLHKALPLQSGGALRINGRALDHLAAPDVVDASVAQALISKLDFPEIARRRRSNYRWLSERLQGVPGLVIPYPELGDSVPLNFPVLLGAGRREPLYFKLRDAGFAPVALYYRLIDPISRERFPESHTVSESILNLPVHQEIEEADLEPMAHLLDQSLRELCGGAI